MISIQNPTRQSLYGIIIFSALVLMSGWVGRWVDALTGNLPGQGPGITLWPAIFMQTTGGIFAGALMTNNMIIVQERWEWLFNPVMEGGAAIILFLITDIGVCLFRNRSLKNR